MRSGSDLRSSAARPVLEIEHLTVSYGTEAGRFRAVDDVSFAIRRGEVLGLVGESGSGKSTIASAVTRLLAANARVEAGRIVLDGEDLSTKSESELRAIRGNQLAIVFQNPLTSLTPSIRIGEQIAEVLRVHRGAGQSAAMVRAVDLLASVGIPEPAVRARQYPHQLSGGMQQRALIAIALACDPAVLIMDEPTTALDVTTEANILDLVVDLKRRVDAGILYITHDLGVVARVCDRVAVLYASQLVEEGSVEEIFREPRHPYTIGLLASIPRPGQARPDKRLAAIPGRIPALYAIPDTCIFGPRCPFAADGCADRPQPLLGLHAGRQSRCERTDYIAGVTWPDEDSGTAGRRGGGTAGRRGGGTAGSIRAEGREAAGPALVAADHLSKEYGDDSWLGGLMQRLGGRLGLLENSRRLRAVDDVSLELREGETFGLVGESGCGKTTLGRMLVRLVDPTSGSVWFDGANVTRLGGGELRAKRRDIQIVFQNPESSLNPRQRIGEILARPLIVFKLAKRDQIAEQVVELLRTVQLPPDYAARYPHELSGGEKQRIGIARALATQPRFVVCDEPVTALDVSVRASILNLLTSLQARFGLTYLFIAHDLGVIRHIADRVAVMYLGRVCEIGPVVDVFAPPHHPYTRALLSAIPVPDPVAARRTTRIRLSDQVAAPSSRQGCIFRDRCPVKIGPICEQEAPPARTPRFGHTIYCHHELSELYEMPTDQLLEVSPYHRAQ